MNTLTYFSITPNQYCHCISHNVYTQHINIVLPAPAYLSNYHSSLFSWFRCIYQTPCPSVARSLWCLANSVWGAESNICTHISEHMRGGAIGKRTRVHGCGGREVSPLPCTGSTSSTQSLWGSRLQTSFWTGQTRRPHTRPWCRWLLRRARRSLTPAWGSGAKGCFGWIQYWLCCTLRLRCHLIKNCQQINRYGPFC